MRERLNRVDRLHGAGGMCSSARFIARLFIFYGLYQGIFRAVGKAFASDFVPGELRASGIGWYSTTVGLLQLVASVVAGCFGITSPMWRILLWSDLCDRRHRCSATASPPDT